MSIPIFPTIKNVTPHWGMKTTVDLIVEFHDPTPIIIINMSSSQFKGLIGNKTAMHETIISAISKNNHTVLNIKKTEIKLPFLITKIKDTDFMRVAVIIKNYVHPFIVTCNVLEFSQLSQFQRMVFLLDALNNGNCAYHTQ